MEKKYVNSNFGIELGNHAVILGEPESNTQKRPEKTNTNNETNFIRKPTSDQ